MAGKADCKKKQNEHVQHHKQTNTRETTFSTWHISCAWNITCKRQS